ncbi:hypothetical protein PV10_08480 [Exophiala mesophila]|uniref:N-acetyltransferase domain-containing protein n=1 Tax=Exophiala mesophila TaxID=212818 RepID=A0A0D1Z238_EXOME|nr:uncharacterized protein PV10_08480 [Exophiala mesophila]KIV88842.1 hypothetical protein PV10_08480 [Exophiala mesophila]
MANFSVHVLPNPPEDEATFREYSNRLRTLRLKSLQSDPDKWISRYDSEIQEQPEFWWNRLRAEGVIHHVLVANAGNDKSSVQYLLEGQWVGFVVTTCPALDMQPEYHIAAVYIDQDFRGRGLGKILMREVLNTVKAEVSKATQPSPYCTIGSLHGNEVAARLYQSMGFQVTDPDEIVERAGYTYHMTAMSMDL